MELFADCTQQDVISPIIWLKHCPEDEGYVALIMLHEAGFGAMLLNNRLRLMLFPRQTTPY
ncbi:hypothetical protein ACQ86O_17110 [Serratia sp. L9]|uniref:hypothetical protein n=1 Tax=Serratia sp. L9 TaxID=3423946 RepID=UPI003D674BC1